MDYYDGNTVTALWNYAQQYSLSDNSYDSNFGPSTPGAINLISGQTNGFQAVTSVTHTPTTDSYAVVDPELEGRRHGHQRPRPGLRRLRRQQPHVDEQPGRGHRPEHR